MVYWFFEEIEVLSIWLFKNSVLFYMWWIEIRGSIVGLDWVGWDRFFYLVWERVLSEFLWSFLRVEVEVVFWVMVMEVF